MTGEPHYMAVPHRAACKSSCRLRCLWDGTPRDGTNCPTTARLSLAASGRRITLEVTFSPSTRLEMRGDLTLASGLLKGLGNMCFGVRGDINAERHVSTTDHRLFFD
jgi:hypothetical protein